MKKEYVLEIVLALLSILLLFYMIFTWNHIEKDVVPASEAVSTSEASTNELYETSLNTLEKIQ